MIDRYLLRYFLAVVDQGSFSRAAQACRVSQPTLSIGIAKLERLLQQKLLDRTNRRVALTPVGSRFAERARRIEAEFGEAEREIAAAAVARRPLRLGVISTLPPAWAEEALTAALAAAQRENIQLELVEARARDLPGLLGRHRVDAIVGVIDRDGPAQLAFFSEEYRVAVASGHPLAGRAEVRATELAGEAMLVRRHCEGLPEISRFFTGHGVRPLMAARTLNDAMAIACVRSGLAITMVPESFATEGLSLIRLAGFSTRRRIGATAHPASCWTLDGTSPVRAFGNRLAERSRLLSTAEG